MDKTKKTHKLNEQDIIDILKLCKENVSFKEVALRFSVNVSTIRGILQKNGFSSSQSKLVGISAQTIADVSNMGRSNIDIRGIMDHTGLTENKVKLILDSLNIPITKVVLRNYVTEEQQARIIQLRKENPSFTKRQISEMTGVNIATVKRIIESRPELHLSNEQRQANAYRSKLAKDPDCMIKLRKGLNSEARQKQGQSLSKYYQENPARIAEISNNSKKWWDGMTETQKQDYLSKRQISINSSNKAKEYRASLDGENNPKFKAWLKKYNVKTPDDLMQLYANNMNGRYLGGYAGAFNKCLWACSEGHEFEMRSNNVTQGQWCPRRAWKVSKPEDAVYVFVKQFYSDAMQGVYGLLSNPKFQLDVYIPSLKNAIEYDGDLWHYMDEEAISRLNRKNEDCKQSGIDLLRIKHSEFMKDMRFIEKQIMDFLGVKYGNY